MVFTPLTYFNTVKSKTAAQCTHSTPANDISQAAEAPDISPELLKTGKHMERRKRDQQGLGKKIKVVMPIHPPLVLLICLPAEDRFQFESLSLSEIL